MSSKSRDHAVLLAEALRDTPKPLIDGLVWDEDDNFRVVESRYNLVRQSMNNEVHSFVVIQPRELLTSATPDRCGFRYSYPAVISVIKKLQTNIEPMAQGLPAAAEEIDSLTEFIEWIQDVVTQGENRRIGTRALTDMTVTAMPDMTRLTEGVYLSELELSYG